MWTGVDGSADHETLLYSTDPVATGRIRFVQVAFIDAFEDDDAVVSDATPFRTVESDDSALASDWREAYFVSRIWSFAETDISSGALPPQFPANDTPMESWYVDWCESVETID